MSGAVPQLTHALMAWAATFTCSSHSVRPLLLMFPSLQADVELAPYNRPRPLPAICFQLLTAVCMEATRRTRL